MNRTGASARRPSPPHTTPVGTPARLAASIVLFVATAALLVPELERPGVTWDEPEYFASADRIATWFAGFRDDPRSMLDPAEIEAAWDPPDSRYYNPHPPVYKEGMALTKSLLGPYVGAVAGYRLFPALLFAALVGLLAWVASGMAGLVGGVGAGLSLLLIPRVYGHAHIAATDMPLTFLWTVTALAFASFLRQGGISRLFVASLALGLALGTKFTGWLLPVPLLAWAVLERRWSPWLFVVGFALVVGYVFVPPAWHHPAESVVRLFEESLSRDETIPVATYYMGKVYEYAVPWQQSIVMTLITVPVGLLAACLLGCADAVRSTALLHPTDDRAAMARLSLLHIGFFLALMALPSSPNHDGVRLFLPIFPFVAILAGLGLNRIHELLRLRLEPPRALLAALLVQAVFLLPAWWQSRQVSPYYLSYYNELIGGPAGADRAGMEVTYWYDAMTPSFLREVESRLPRGSTVLGWPSAKYFRELQELGLLRRDLVFSQDPSASYLLMLARKATLQRPFLDVYEQVQPLLAVELDGVELAGLYAWTNAE